MHWLLVLLPQFCDVVVDVFVAVVAFLQNPFAWGHLQRVANRLGSSAFAVNDTSRNLLPVDRLMLDESHHNNHYRFPTQAKLHVR